jgi:PAS domain S-box-containing protein
MNTKSFDNFISLKDALENNSTYFWQIFHSIPDAVILIDPNDYGDISWPIVGCNEAACKMNGYSREELIGKSIDVLHIGTDYTEDRTEYLENLRKKSATGSHYETDAIHRTKDGTQIDIHCCTS